MEKSSEIASATKWLPTVLDVSLSKKELVVLSSRDRQGKAGFIDSRRRKALATHKKILPTTTREENNNNNNIIYCGTHLL